MAVFGEPGVESLARFRNGFGADDAAGVETEFGRTGAQLLAKIRLQKSRS
jgi:hypothetical protein